MAGASPVSLRTEMEVVMGWNNDYSWADNGAGHVLMMLGMLLFWALVVAAVVWVVRQDNSRNWSAGRTAPSERTAQQMLAERFARGEIDENEFTSRLAALHSQSQP